MSPITPSCARRARGKILLALPVVLAAAALAGGVGAQGPDSPLDAPPGVEGPERELSRVIVSVVTERWAALGLRGGDVVVYDLAGGKRYQWTSPAFPIVNLALDPMGIGAVPAPPVEAMPDGGARTPPIVLLTVEGPGSHKTTMHILRGDDGLSLTEIRIPGSPVALVVAPGEGRAFVITGSGPEAAAKGRTGRWTLRDVDLTRMRVEASTTLTGIVHGAALSQDGGRIFVGLEGAIRSFNTRPLQSSWMLRSPGRNRILAPSGPAGSLVVVRDSQLALLNPEGLPARDPVTGSPPEDDASLVVDLPFIGRFMDINEEAGEAVVLDARGSRMATVDLELGTVSRVQQVPQVAAASFHPSRETLLLFQQYAERVFEMLHSPPDRDARIAGAGPGEPVEPVPPGGPAQEASPPARSPEGPPAGTGGATPRPSSSGPPRPAAPPGREPAGAAGGEPSPPGPPGSPGTGQEPAVRDVPPPPPPETPGAGAARQAGEAPEPASPPPGEGAEASREGTEPASPEGREPEVSPPEALEGRIEGDLEVVEAVVFFGPDAVLREHARIRPEADGSFSLPRPPDGRYRVVVQGQGGAQLRCSPPVRFAVVGQEPLPALDFKVEGVLPGRLRAE